MSIRVFVMLTWSPQLGAAADPVGVLGVDDSARPPRSYVSWMPLTFERAHTWQRRLAAPIRPDQVLDPWLRDASGTQLQEVEAPERDSLLDTVEAVMDDLLAHVVPYLPTPEDGS